MQIRIHTDKASLGQAAAEDGAEAIRTAIHRSGTATITVATGASQFEMLDALVAKDIDWSRVTAFHLDEYVGLGSDHPASFRGYLADRFVDRVGHLKAFVPVNGDAIDIDDEVARLNGLISQHAVDVCFAGIGENCHLAFNDPPADFETEAPYIVTKLDDACRRQQLAEGWFSSLEEVPNRAISMSIKQIMKARKLVLSVPDARKAEAVRNAVENEVTNVHPASICQRHADATLHLDPPSAGYLSASIAEAQRC